MPGYKRKTYRRKNKRVFKKKYTGVAAGVKALKIVRSMQKAIEYKHNDYPIIADDVAATGMCYPLIEAIAKGDNKNNRTADLIKLARAHIYCSVHLPVGSAETLSRSFRVMLVRGIRENGSIPVMAYPADLARGVLDSTTVPLIIARKALDNMRNTKTLFDKVYTITPGQKTKFEFRWNFKLGWNARFQTGTSNLLEDGGLYLLVCADYNSGDMLIDMNHRITFSDD